MKIYASVVVMLAVALFSAPLWSEQSRHINVHNISLVDDGKTDQVNAVIRDKRGFLWLATDNGMRRYDGYTLTHFKHDSEDSGSLGSHSIISLLLDKNNVLWMAGKNLNRFNPLLETFDTYDVTENKYIWAMSEGDNGILWLGGENFGLVEFNTNTNKVENRFLMATEKEQSLGYISAIVSDLDSSNKIWIASGAGLLLFDVDSHTHRHYEIPINIGAGVDSILSLLVAKNGLVWIASREGVVVLNPNTGNIRHYKFDPDDPHSLSSNAIWHVFQDSKGAIWIGTDKHGVNRYRPESDDFLRLESSSADEKYFPVAAIESINEDENGSLWFSAAAFGVRRISESLERFEVLKTHSKPEQGLAFNNVLGLLEDKNGYIWIATDGGGLDRYNPKTHLFKHYTHDPKNSNSISSDSVISLAEDAEGNIWVGTWAGGLNRLNPETGVFTHIVNNVNLPEGESLGNNNVFRVAFDKEGWLWISLWRKGVQRYNPKTGEFRSYFSGGLGKESGISNNSVNDFYFTEDEAGSQVVWIAGHDEFERFDIASEIATQFTLDGVEGIFDIHRESDNIMWLATTDGLIRFNIKTKEKTFYTDKDGLSNNLILSIEEDSEGYLWLGTRLGLSRFDRNKKTFRTYDEYDGLAGTQFNRYSHLQARSGKMYFGTTQGLTVFDPLNLPANTHKPNVVITDFEVFQKTIKPGEKEFLPHHISLTKEIRLPYDQRDIAFRFSALNFISPDKNLYRYRLLGLEDEWTHTNAQGRRARYTNLAPGKYIFQVLGSNNDGFWNEEGASIDLIIMPSWWMTWWMRIIEFILFVAFIYGVIFWRLRAESQRKNELEVLVKKKTKEIEAGNRSIRLLNSDLENRVEQRTEELSLEVEERRIVEAKLFHMAFHDALTTLPNRSWLIRQLESIIKRGSERSDFNFGLMFLDGDGFKKINDTYGHMIGDGLLVEVARRLEKVVPEGHSVARLGGDEFTVLIDKKTDEAELVQVAKSIVSAFNEPFFIDNNRISFKVSIGMVLCNNDYKAPAQILRDADISMYRAKAKGKGTYQLFDQYMREQAIGLVALENDLQWALERNEFELVYQPIIYLDTGDLKGFEALLRWKNGDKGYIPPDVFIPVAEESGLIVPIGLWVLHEACQQLSCWLNDFELPTPPTIAVNISALQLSQENLIENIDEILLESGIDSRLLKLEITESSLMENTDSMNKMLDALRARGIELAIDDFGTGYSSLSYLDKLPVQVLKIDRSFVDAMIDKDGSGGAAEIVRATISLAHNLNLQVVAEGIETQAQYDRLKSYGCDFGQGYLMSKPLSRNNATAYMMNTTIDVEADKLISTSVNENFEPIKHYRKYRDK